MRGSCGGAEAGSSKGVRRVPSVANVMALLGQQVDDELKSFESERPPWAIGPIYFGFRMSMPVFHWFFLEPTPKSLQQR